MNFKNIFPDDIAKMLDNLLCLKLSCVLFLINEELVVAFSEFIITEY